MSSLVWLRATVNALIMYVLCSRVDCASRDSVSTNHVASHHMTMLNVQPFLVFQPA